MTKEFKTIDQQIEILKNKGLIIGDENKAYDILLKENYFFINGYRHLFMNSPSDKTFVSGATFDELYALFQFDRYSRNIFFKNLLIIENRLKSVISYQLSKKYGYKEKDYLNYRNFTQNPEKKRKVKDVIEKMKRQIRINTCRHNATMHYLNNYGYIPLWILVKVLSFGMVCELFTILKDEDKLEIASIFNISVEYLEDFLPILSNYRNLCAHEDIVFDHKTERVIPDTEYHKKLNIFKMDDEYIYGKNDIFSVIIIFKFMLEDDEFRLMIKEFEYEFAKLDAEVDSIPSEKILDTMGIPKNYMNIIDM
ncbi:MAG: Abi family protein [Mycoplasmatota bacterium]|nr:Abi family protein [Mycoplasmatota bacterium]